MSPNEYQKEALRTEMNEKMDKLLPMALDSDTCKSISRIIISDEWESWNHQAEKIILPSDASFRYSKVGAVDHVTLLADTK